MSSRSEIRPFSRLFENRHLLHKAGSVALNEVIDWPKVVVSPLLTMGWSEDCFAPSEFADDMASHGIFALPYDKFVVVMGPCPASQRSQDNCHWVSTVERREDQLVGRSFVVGSDFFRNGAGVWSFKIGSSRDEWIDNSSDGLNIDDEAKTGSSPIIRHGDPESTTKNLLTEKYFWITSIFQCVGLLSSKGVSSETIPAPRSINKKREEKNLSPIFSYRVLTIDPQEAASARAEIGGTHASPRLHWRRGHIRKLSEGRHTVVKPCLVGSIERGYVAKDYKIKTTVSH